VQFERTARRDDLAPGAGEPTNRAARPLRRQTNDIREILGRRLQEHEPTPSVRGDGDDRPLDDGRGVGALQPLAPIDEPGCARIRSEEH